MYKNIKYWLQNYVKEEYGDQRAITDFAEIETREVITSLKNELIGIQQGSYEEDLLIPILGHNRLIRHSAYSSWATLMLQWIAVAQK